MTTTRGLHATLTRCRCNRPLAILHSSPFNDLEITPGDLRIMAGQLNSLAELAECLPAGRERYRQVRVAPLMPNETKARAQ